MDFLRSIWPNSSTSVITIPQHNEGEFEDDLDLKVKALTYLFKRLNIENLPSFINDENGMFNLNSSGNSGSNEKLDTIYNKSEFERYLMSDGHRILIDWFKNRFRSICILSDTPQCPYEAELSKRNHFRFLILKSDSSDDEYIDLLVNSDIYTEYGIDRAVKQQIIKDILTRQRENRPSFKKQFNKNDRSNIILKYVSKLSEVVQIERIYQASIISKLETFKHNKITNSHPPIKEEQEDANKNNTENGVKVFPNTNIISRSRSTSPTRSDYSNSSRLPPVKLSPVKLAQPSSPTIPKLRSRSSSPVKSLKKKQSMTILKLDKSLNKSKEEEEEEKEKADTNEDELITKEDKVNLHSQAEQAVLSRVERESKLIREH